MEDFKSGLILSEIKPLDWVYNEYTPLIGGEIRNATGNWEMYLPFSEIQNRWGYDRMACVSFAELNWLETDLKYQTGKDSNKSDRFLAAISHTSRQGNSVDNVFDHLREHGVPDEAEWPDTDKGWDDYYKEIPQNVQDDAKKFLDDWILYREWVNTTKKENILSALKETCLPVTVRYAEGQGLLNPVGPWQHEVLLFNAEEGHYWEIFDHYTQNKKKYAWDYEFGSVLKPSLIKKNNLPVMTFKNNTLLQLVEGHGDFGLFIDNKIILDDLAKIQAVWIVRNNGDIKDMVKPVTLEQWMKYDKYDLKGNKITN